ncbi:MAG: HAD family phosphatase [Erysipelotrichaceae bacterium]|nr:HAD family phosphatase [Erysipelotrichaceae bacterium]
MNYGAIFDMDGLLFDTEQVFQKNWTAIADEMGIELDPAFRRTICGTNGALMNSIIERFYHVEDGQPIQEDVYNRVHRDLENSVPEKPGLREILQFFRDKGYKIAVASSSTKEQIRHNMELAGVTDYFDAFVSGKEVEHGKPAPDVFLKAAKDIGCDPQNCYVFEDAFNGVQAGYASGAKVIMVPDMLQPTDEIRALTHHVCSSLLEAVEVLSKEI